VCIELHPSFGSSKNTSPTSADLSAHARAAEPVSQTVPSVNSTTLSEASSQIQSSNFRFGHNIDFGAVDPYVRELQIYLNTNGFRVADNGPGSPGREVDVFDAATRVALSNFRRHMRRKFWFRSELRRGRVGLQMRRANTSMKCNQHKPTIHKAAQTSNTQRRTGQRRNSWCFRPVLRLCHIAALNHSEDSPAYPVATEIFARYRFAKMA
jgi:hypothetical protein